MRTFKNQSVKILSRGEVAKLTGVGIETVRFYEQKGLIEEPERSSSGYREYSQDFVKRIRFIQQAKKLGFSLKEISSLLSLRVDPQKTCKDVKRLTQTKISDVDKKIVQLKKIKRALGKLAAACRGKGPTSECPILEALDLEKPQ
ncbi:MAG: MerR family DNA-binding protein [Deltaproteobacteria bacterium]|nr:MerR family DNA-binding protein [Deltaproteobacteria bacterium]